MSDTREVYGLAYLCGQCDASFVMKLALGLVEAKNER